MNNQKNKYNQLIIVKYNNTENKQQKEAKYELEIIKKYKKLIELFNKYVKKYLHYKKKEEALRKNKYICENKICII